MMYQSEFRIGIFLKNWKIWILICNWDEWKIATYVELCNNSCMSDDDDQEKSRSITMPSQYAQFLIEIWVFFRMYTHSHNTQISQGNLLI